MISYEIERLLRYGYEKDLIKQLDIIPCRNQLMDLLQVKAPYVFDQDEVFTDCPDNPSAILANIADDMVERKLIGNTLTQRDLLEDRIMGILLPRASEVYQEFCTCYEQSPEEATQYYYDLSKNANYIKTQRLQKNKYWTAETAYGNLEITINLSKPEKDPKEIALLKSQPQTGYPKCLLCKENAGFAGNLNHPARQNLRLIPMELNKEQWFFQYSPYLYYNEHSIILNGEHTPMKISKETFIRLAEFINYFPHYFIGSNADLPIVGGSILNHDHFQGGRHVFPMEKAKNNYFLNHSDYPGICASIIKWPMSTIRLVLTDKSVDHHILIDAAWAITQRWQTYSDKEADIHAFTRKTPHNTVTPIMRKNDEGLLELDIVLRNNRKTRVHPYGLFHPHKNLHHIKKENIGLIEVMGLAVLPGRLEEEMRQIQSILTGETLWPLEKMNKKNSLYQHKDWIEDMVARYGRGLSEDEAQELLQKEIGRIFTAVLYDCGVFKDHSQGHNQFIGFLNECGFSLL